MALDGGEIASMESMDKIFKGQSSTFYLDFEGLNAMIAQLLGGNVTPQAEAALSVLGMFDDMEAYGTMKGGTMIVNMVDKEQNSFKTICGKTGEKRCVFGEDCCNDLIAKGAECDGFIVGSPVYYAGMAGSLRALMDRMFYAGGANFRFKPAAGIAVARRAGAIEAADQINKYFQINCQPLVSSSYWNLAYGRTPGEAEGDGEGLHTMRVLGRNMAWMLKCIEAGRAAGINAPEMEPKVMTNVVREDLLGE